MKEHKDDLGLRGNELGFYPTGVLMGTWAPGEKEEGSGEEAAPATELLQQERERDWNRPGS